MHTVYVGRRLTVIMYRFMYRLSSVFDRPTYLFTYLLTCLSWKAFSFNCHFLKRLRHCLASYRTVCDKCRSTGFISFYCIKLPRSAGSRRGTVFGFLYLLRCCLVGIPILIFIETVQENGILSRNFQHLRAIVPGSCH